MKFDLSGPGTVTGAVLAAVPELKDPNFNQTLVYIAEHSSEGAFGLVMNRPLGKKLGDLAAVSGMSETMSSVGVFFGGPVRPDNLLLALFQPGEKPDDLICRLDAPIDEAEELLRDGEGWVRAFSGYAGWGEGQLDGELERSAWKICRPDPVLFVEKYLQGLWSVYVSEDDRWRNLISVLPDDPTLN